MYITQCQSTYCDSDGWRRNFSKATRDMNVVQMDQEQLRFTLERPWGQQWQQYLFVYIFVS